MFSSNFWSDLVLTLVFLIGPFLIYLWCKRLPVPFDKDRVAILNTNYALFNTLYAVFLGMALVSLLNTFYASKDATNREAESVLLAYRLSLGLHLSPELPFAIQEYAKNIRDLEFPAMAEGHMSPGAQQSLDTVWRLTLHATPMDRTEEALHRALLSELSEISKQRLTRSVKLSENLHPSVVFIIYFGYLLMLAKFWHTRIDWPGHQLMNECIVVGLFMAAVVIILDLKTPFSGIVNVDVEPFAQVLDRMRTIVGH